VSPQAQFWLTFAALLLSPLIAAIVATQITETLNRKREEHTVPTTGRLEAGDPTRKE
jgi:hypothetical protein